MKWSFYSEVKPPGARISVPSSRFGLAQQLIALALALCLCIIAAVAVSGRFNFTPTPTPQPTAPAVLLPATLAPADTVAPLATIRPTGTATVAPQAAKFSCGNGTAETRYVADRGGAIVFDSVDTGAATVATLTYRTSVQVYGTVTGRLTGNSDKWYAVRYSTRCAYIWADPADSRLSKTQPK